MKLSPIRLVLLVVLLGAPVVQARPVATPSTEWLWEEAELVAVIQPESTWRNEDLLTHAGPKYGPRNPDDYQGLNTRCTIEAIFKRSESVPAFSADSLVILHFAFSGGQLEFNGGMFIYFALPPMKLMTLPVESDSGEPLMASAWRQRPSYLAFLRRRDDGRFEPITGNYDSAPSFRVLTTQLDGQGWYAHLGIPGGEADAN